MPIWQRSGDTTAVGHVGVPEHLLADEHHQPRHGRKNDRATIVAESCWLGVGEVQSETSVEEHSR